jgi:hypothetical protein
MSFATRITLLHSLYGLSLIAIGAGFASLIIGSVTGSYLENIRLLLAAGFALAFLTLPFLAHAKCPRCAERFCGPQSDNTTSPGTNTFTRQCQYCGFSPFKKAP